MRGSFTIVLVTLTRFALVSSNCPCLTRFPATTQINVKGEVQVRINGGAVYWYPPNPSQYGLGCGTHDVGRPPLCNQTYAPSWCSSEWCWVDPSACSGVPHSRSNWIQGLSYSYSTCGAEDTFNGGLLCRTHCQADASNLTTVTVINHGSESDVFWQEMKTAAIEAADYFGVAIDWRWASSASSHTDAVRAHAQQRPSRPLVLSIPDASVANATRELSDRNLSFFSFNSPIGLAALSGTLAHIAMDDEQAGEHAARHLLSAGVTRPVFINHGAPIGSNINASEWWALARWTGFRRVFAASGIEVAHLPLGVNESAWDATFRVHSAAQRELLIKGSTGLFRGSGLADGGALALRYDGILCSGKISMYQVAHVFHKFGCWMAHRPCGRIIVGTVDDDLIARRLLNEDKLSFIVNQRQFLQMYLSVALAALSARSPPVLPHRPIAIDTTSLFENASRLVDAQTALPCDTFCLIENMLQRYAISGSGQNQKCSLTTNLTMDAAILGSGSGIAQGTSLGLASPGTPLLVCRRSSSQIQLSESQHDCAAEVGIKFCPSQPTSSGVLELVSGSVPDGTTTTQYIAYIVIIVGCLIGACIVVTGAAKASHVWRQRQAGLKSLAEVEDSRSIPRLREAIQTCEKAGVRRAKSLVLAKKKLEWLKGGKYIDVEALLDVVEFGATKLVKGSWLRDSCNRIPRQQDLPPLAYWDPNELRSLIHTVEIVAISYSWLHKVHPDPESEHLRTLKEAIRLRLALKGPGAVHDLAIFMDYMSLPQHGEVGPENDPGEGCKRTLAEKDAFSKGLSNVNLWYAHKDTTVWMLKWTPEGKPKYADRGWPFFEQATSFMIKDSSRIFDIEPELDSFPDWIRSGRHPPIIPEDFRTKLDKKTFTNDDDTETVGRKYDETFHEVVVQAQILMLSGLNWGDDEAAQLAKALPLCNRLEQLVLSNNEISDTGVSVVVESAKKHCGLMQRLDFRDNPVDTVTQDLGISVASTRNIYAKRIELSKILVQFSPDAGTPKFHRRGSGLSQAGDEGQGHDGTDVAAADVSSGTDGDSVGLGDDRAATASGSGAASGARIISQEALPRPELQRQQRREHTPPLDDEGIIGGFRDAFCLPAQLPHPDEANREGWHIGEP